MGQFGVVRTAFLIDRFWTSIVPMVSISMTNEDKSLCLTIFSWMHPLLLPLDLVNGSKTPVVESWSLLRAHPLSVFHIPCKWVIIVWMTYLDSFFVLTKTQIPSRLYIIPIHFSRKGVSANRISLENSLVAMPILNGREWYWETSSSCWNDRDCLDSGCIGIRA